MIYYFTGTGNSLSVAQQLGEQTGSELMSIAEVLQGVVPKEDDEVVGIVFPIYAWSPPEIVLDFIRCYPIKARYVYAVCTCAQEAGHAMRRVELALGRKLDSAFSVIMPNNYPIGPFNIDSAQHAERCLEEAKERVEMIAGVVKQEQQGVFDMAVGGRGGGLKTAVIAPLFDRFACSTKSFYAEDSCTACGICQAMCPTQNISVKEKPQWGRNCVSCMACLNYCPEVAIQKGKGTKKKGRYVNPNCRPEYDFSPRD